MMLEEQRHQGQLQINPKLLGVLLRHRLEQRAATLQLEKTPKVSKPTLAAAT